MARSHRTALVIDMTNPNAKTDYVERVKRLQESLNGPNIKVDVYTFRNGEITAGFSESAAPKASSNFAESARAFAAELGYTQVLLEAPAV